MGGFKKILFYSLVPHESGGRRRRLEVLKWGRKTLVDME